MSKQHSCYFHKNKPITYFCTLPRCTLPMCEECLPIHTQEHSSEDNDYAIVPFRQAQDKAVSELKVKVNSLSKHRKQCEQNLKDAREKLIELVHSYIGQQESALNALMKDYEECEKKLTKIQKGSLKTLIYFYSNQEKSLQEFERAVLAYREALNTKVSELKGNFLDKFTISQGQVPSTQPEPTTVRDIQANKVTTYARQEAYSREKEEVRKIESGHERDGSRDKSYQHRQIFSNHRKLVEEVPHQQKKVPQERLQTQQNGEGYHYESRKFNNREIHSRNRTYTETEGRNQFKYLEEYKTRDNLQANHNRSVEGKQQWKPLETFQRREGSINKYQSKQSQYIKIDEEWSKKPLLPSDLNLELGNSLRAHPNKSDGAIRVKEISSNRVQLNKQVLSPEEIRKMLEKRIEERSRIISKTKAITPPRHQEQSVQEYERNWDTKDSIINQIYNDYRY